MYKIRCVNIRALVRDLFPIEYIPGGPLSSNVIPASCTADNNQSKINRYSAHNDSNIADSAYFDEHTSNDTNDKQFGAYENNCILSDEQLWELVEASNTVYVNGKWISLRDDNDDKHSILSAKVPTNGDYQAYFIWSKSISFIHYEHIYDNFNFI